MNPSNKIVQNFRFKPLSDHQPFLILQSSAASYGHPESFQLFWTQSRPSPISFGLECSKENHMSYL